MEQPHGEVKKVLMASLMLGNRPRNKARIFNAVPAAECNLSRCNNADYDIAV